MKRIIKLLLFIVPVTVLALGVFPAFAQVQPVDGQNLSFPGIRVNANADAGTIEAVLDLLLQAVIFLIGVIATIFLVYAGIKYISSQGSEENSAQAKRQIVYAIVGVAIATSAYTIRQAILEAPSSPAGAAESLLGVIQPFITTAQFLIGTIAVIFLIYAGYKYITSFGNEEASATAKKQITYAIVGIIVALGAGVILSAITIVDQSGLTPGTELGGPSTLVGGQQGATILTNFINPIILLAVYLVGTFATIFFLFAGYQYITSQGDAERAAAGKRQMAYAIIGIVVALGANVFRNAIINVNSPLNLLGGEAGGSLIATYLAPIINLATFLGSTFAGIYLVYAGYQYITSGGDEEQASTAKRQILYAIIGLIIFGTFSLISAAVFTTAVGDAGSADAVSSLRGRLWFIISRFLLLVSIATGAYLVWGGVQYITSQGNEDQAAKAKLAIIYSIVGLLVIALSAAIANFAIFAAIGT